MHRVAMDDRGRMARVGFWALALLWLPAGVVAQAVVRFGSDYIVVVLPTEVVSLAPFAACGLPLALGCRGLRRLGYRRGAWLAGTGLGAVTVAAAVGAGLLGPIAVAVCAVGLSLPVWGAWWLARRG